MSKTSNKKNLKEQGNAFYKEQKFDQAILCYQKYISQSKEDPSQNKFAFLNMSLCYFKQKKYEQCIQACNEALNIDPQYMKSYYRKVYAYEKLGNFYEGFINALKCYDLFNSDEKQKLQMQKKINEHKKQWLQKNVNAGQAGGQNRLKQRKTAFSQGNKNGGTFWDVTFACEQLDQTLSQKITNAEQLFLEISPVKLNDRQIEIMVEQNRHIECINQLFNGINQIKKENLSESFEQIKFIRKTIKQIKQKVKTKQRTNNKKPQMKQQGLLSQGNQSQKDTNQQQIVKKEEHFVPKLLITCNSLSQLSDIQKLQAEKPLNITSFKQNSQKTQKQETSKIQKVTQISQKAEKDRLNRIQKLYEQHFHHNLKQTKDDFLNFFRILMATLTNDKLSKEQKIELLKILPQKIKLLGIFIAGLSKNQRNSLKELLRKENVQDSIVGIKQYQKLIL